MMNLKVFIVSLVFAILCSIERSQCQRKDIEFHTMQNSTQDSFRGPDKVNKISNNAENGTLIEVILDKLSMKINHDDGSEMSGRSVRKTQLNDGEDKTPKTSKTETVASKPKPSTNNKQIHTFTERDRASAYQITEASDHPYTVALVVTRIDGDSFCSGSLLALDWVLTAAHCVRNVENITLYVGSGFNVLKPDEISQQAQVRFSNDVYSHPDYNDLSKDYDVGLIRVSPSFGFTDLVQPITLSTANWEEGSRRCAMTAFGRVRAGAQSPDDYMRKTQQLEVEKPCACGSAIASDVGTEAASRITCLKPTRDFGLCVGDMGGGLVCEGELTAVASLGYSAKGLSCALPAPDPAAAATPTAAKEDADECGDGNSLSVFQDTFPSLSWIQRHVPHVGEDFDFLEKMSGGKGSAATISVQLGVYVIMVVMFCIF